MGSRAVFAFKEQEMPRVKGKRFPYTAFGKAAAKRAAGRTKAAPAPPRSSRARPNANAPASGAKRAEMPPTAKAAGAAARSSGMPARTAGGAKRALPEMPARSAGRGTSKAADVIKAFKGVAGTTARTAAGKKKRPGMAARGSNTRR